MDTTSTAKNDTRPIICGTDFSAAAAEAGEVAAGLANRLQTKLILVHVTEFYGMAEVDPSLFEAGLFEKKTALDGEADRLRALGATVEGKMLSGSVFDELIGAVTTSNARLLVVGAVGHGLSRRLLVGSVAERSAETSPVPTLVVRPGSPLAAWARGEHILKILVGYDFSIAADAALQWLQELRGVGRCEIHVLHIDWPPRAAVRLGYHGPLPLHRNPEQVQNFLEADLAERVEMFLARDNVTLRVEPGWGVPEACLFEAANREKADLVVVGTHRRHDLGRWIFGSVSRSVLRHATAPVAIIPPRLSRSHARLPEFARVLVATDFSALGDAAILHACAALQRGGTLKLVHVLSSAAQAASPNEPHPEKENPKLRTRLRALVPEEAAAKGEIETEIIASDEPALAISQAAERFRASLVCLGSHGRTALAKTFLGSVAQGVMTLSNRPVLIVREGGS